MRRTFVSLLVAAPLALAPGCEWFGLPGAPSVPGVSLAGGQALLVQPPTLRALAHYSCDRILGSIACLALGRPPTKEELQFRFQVPLQVSNPGRVPVPTTEMLVGLHVYPSQSWGELGAACVTLCQPGSADCPATPAGACADTDADLDSAADFLAAAGGGALALASEAATGQAVGGQLAGFTVPAGGRLDLKVTFAIGIDPMISLVQNGGPDVLAQALGSGGRSLDIPYAVGGRVWFSVPYLGRAGTGFGPVGAPPDAPLVWKVL